MLGFNRTHLHAPLPPRSPFCRLARLSAPSSALAPLTDDEDSNIKTLAAAFIRRCHEKGIPLVPRKGKALSYHRARGADIPIFEEYRDKVIGPALREFQEKNGKLTLLDIGNWDEAQLDLNNFSKEVVLVIDCMGANVLVPNEQSPHITILTGFVGDKHLTSMLVKIGSDDHAPHPAVCQMLNDEHHVVVAQSSSGWINNKLKTAFVQYNLDDDECPLGKRPLWINADGHVSQTHNYELSLLARKHKFGLACPPAHTSAANIGGTQQCDQSARLGGIISREKSWFGKLLRRQIRASLKRGVDDGKGHVSMSEIARMYEMAVVEAFDPSLVEELNKSVGYYIDEEDYLAWDILRVVDMSSVTLAQTFKGSSEGSTAVDEEVAGSTTRSGFKEVRFQQQQELNANMADALKRMKGAGYAVERFAEAPVERAQPVPRSKGSVSKYGCIVSSVEHIDQKKADKQKVIDVADLATRKIQAVWEQHRKAIRDAEAALKDKGTPSKLKVGQLKALIRSRTANPPKAQSNKKRGAVDDGEGLVLKELRAAIALNPTTLLPPTPEKADDAGGGAGGVEGGDGTGTAAAAAIAEAGDNSEAEEMISVCPVCNWEGMEGMIVNYCGGCGASLAEV